MKILEIRKLPTKELATRCNTLKEEIADLKRRVHMGEITNVRLIRSKRKDLAKVLTVLSEQFYKETQ